MTHRPMSPLLGIVLAAATMAITTAHPITITFTGTATGSIGSTQFTDATFTITFTTDTSLLAAPPCCPADVTTPSGTSATISVANVNATFTDTQAVFVNSSEDDIGIWHYSPPDFLTIGNPAFQSYNLGYSLGPLSGTTNVFTNSFSTSQGTLSISSVNGVTFNAVVTGATPWKFIAGADFDRNGTVDALWQDPQTGDSQVNYLDGTTNAGVTGFDNVTGTKGWRIAAVADFNQDGIPDLVWQDPSSGTSQIWFMSGATGTVVGSWVALTGAKAWRIIGAADFNHDGVPDLVWQDPSSGDSQVWFMGGPQGATLQSFATLTGAKAWRIAAIGDFNRDGSPDLVWQDPSSGDSQVWFMGGPQGTSLISFATLTGAKQWRITTAADFNGDGVPDLVWQDPASGNAQIWFMGGTNGIVLQSFVSVTPVR